MAEGSSGRGHHRLRSRIRLQIRIDGQCRAARSQNLGGDFLDQRGAVHQHHTCTLGRRGHCHAATDTLRRARDDHRPAGETLRRAHHASALAENFS